MITLYVCSKINSITNDDLIKLDLNESNANLLTIGYLLSSILDKCNLKSNDAQYQLICFGRKLKEDKHLSYYGIKSNSIVYLFKKSINDIKLSNQFKIESDRDGKGKKAKYDQTEIHNMILASRTALMNADFRKTLKKLYEKDFRESLMQCTPDLRNDPIALAVLQDPELLTLMMDLEKINTILERHPAILEAATYLAAAFHEEVVSKTMSSSKNSSASLTPSEPAPVSYSLDDLSEEDEMIGGVDAPPPDGQHVMSPTTASTFADLMQQAILQHQQQQQQHILSRLNQSNNENGRITAEMLREALQFTQQPSTSANDTFSSSFTLPASTRSQTFETNTSNEADMSRQLQQMHDLGINDDNLCMRALRAADGDVQAAVDLIFSENFNP